MASYKDNTQVSVYIDTDLNAELEKRADMADMSKSGYIREVLVDHIESDLITETSREVEAEERIEELVAQASGEITDTTETALDEMQAHLELMQLVLLRTGMYSVGTWEVLKQDHGEMRVKQAMQSASQRFHDDAKDMGININALGTDRSLRRDASNGSKTSSTDATTTNTPSSADSTETSGDDGEDTDGDDDDGWSY